MFEGGRQQQDKIHQRKRKRKRLIDIAITIAIAINIWWRSFSIINPVKYGESVRKWAKKSNHLYLIMSCSHIILSLHRFFPSFRWQDVHT